MSKTISKLQKDLKTALIKRKNDLLVKESAKDRNGMEDIEMGHGDQVDMAESSSEMEMSMRMRLRSSEEIHLINEALEKIKNGVYGICEKCEDNIESKRLKVRPFVKYCINCQEIIERGTGS